jgi:nudix-type nucleoside diphosphatase (YffH/AdpP family)
MTIDVASETVLHQGWLRVSRVVLRFPDGKTLEREIEHHGNAVAVLPYDPARRTALLIRQFRTAAFVSAGDGFLLETIAGIIEQDGTEESGRREAMEEAGLRLGTLEYCGRAWTTPGFSTEQMSMYLATYGAADRVATGGGIGDEDIEVVELSLRELASLADRDGLKNMTTLALVQTLRLRHPELFTP